MKLSLISYSVKIIFLALFFSNLVSPKRLKAVPAVLEK